MKKSSSFSGSLGFVLAAAGSAVGVGNIWRFPYLCAKDGGGLFLLVYLVLVLTFGFTLLTTDVAIGRRTKQNALNAFATLNKKWKFLGYLTFLVPTLIMTYYSVIGGWITKYSTLYLVSSGDAAAQAVVDRYLDDLACGVANIANIFFPEVIALSGGVPIRATRCLSRCGSGCGR